jgi:membrane protease YdiL (CAAX protease family)
VLLGFPGLLVLAHGAYEAAKAVLPPPAPGDFSFGLEEMMRIFSSWPLLFAVLVVGVGPGIGEELMFRGFLGRGLVGRYGVVAGVVLTSLLFGLIHLIPSQAIFAALMGIPLHYVYLTTRSLWLPMLLHFLNNGLQMALISDNGPDLSAVVRFLEVGTAQHPLPMYGGAALLVAAVGWALYRSRARLADIPAEGGEPWTESSGPEVRPWRPTFPGVAYPPAGSSTVVRRPRLGAAWLVVAVAALVCAAAWYQAWALLGPG